MKKWFLAVLVISLLLCAGCGMFTPNTKLSSTGELEKSSQADVLSKAKVKGKTVPDVSIGNTGDNSSVVVQQPSPMETEGNSSFESSAQAGSSESLTAKGKQSNPLTLIYWGIGALLILAFAVGAFLFIKYLINKAKATAVGQAAASEIATWTAWLLHETDPIKKALGLQTLAELQAKAK